MSSPPALAGLHPSAPGGRGGPMKSQFSTGMFKPLLSFPLSSRPRRFNVRPALLLSFRESGLQPIVSLLLVFRFRAPIICLSLRLFGPWSALSLALAGNGRQWPTMALLVRLDCSAPGRRTALRPPPVAESETTTAQLSWGTLNSRLPCTEQSPVYRFRIPLMDMELRR